MSVTLHAAPRTRSEFLALPDDGSRHELIESEHLVTTAPPRRHQRIAGRLLYLLQTHVRLHHIGEVLFSPAPAEAPLVIDLAELFGA